MVVDAKPTAVEFYQRYGFEAFEIISGALGDRPAPLPMILPLGSIPGNWAAFTTGPEAMPVLVFSANDPSKRPDPFDFFLGQSIRPLASAGRPHLALNQRRRSTQLCVSGSCREVR